MSVTIFIVNWNSGSQLSTCIQSIKSISTNLVNQITVIDNCSVDGSAISTKNLSKVKLIELKFNIGFGKACNLSLNNTSSDYLLFLNPDAAIHPDTLDRSVAFMQDSLNQCVGICGVQLLDEKGDVSRSCTRFPSPFSFTLAALGLDRIFPGWGHVMTEWSHDQTRDVDHVIGAYYLVRRQLFEDLGGFDERFFLYLEDLDFSLRAKRAGWRSVYLADIQAFHAGGGTSKQVKSKRLFYSLRSRLLYAFKHFSLAGALIVFFVTFFIEPMSRSVFALLRGSLPALKETWHGYAMLWRWIPQWIFKGVTR